VAAILLLDSGGGVAPQRASAASVLRASATALHRAVSLELKPGEYLYTRIAVWQRPVGAPESYLVRSIDETWLARDGSVRGVERMRGVEGRPGGHEAPPSVKSHHVALRRSSHPFQLTPGVSLSYSELRRLPSDLEQLSAKVSRLADRQARHYAYLGLASASTWRAVLTFDILRGLAASPARIGVRASVYRVLAHTPGIRLVGPATDSVGRYGDLLTATLGAFRYTLLIDPATGQLLETSRTLLHRSTQAPGWRPGLVNRATYLAVGVVRSTDQHVP
jgi:hypothetical protein